MTVLDEYLQGVSNLLRTKNSEELQRYLRVEPSADLPPIFLQLSQELKTSYKDGNVLERKVTKLLPENDEPKEEEGTSWPGFSVFMKEYLEYWRDVNFEDLLETHSQLSGLANACITALSNSQYGILVLPATIQLCDALAKLAMTLDKRPDLTRRLRKVANLDQGETRKSLVEGTAESIQRAFTMCLTERSANRNGMKDGKPEGKKVGIYSFANLVLKLLFQCRKTRLANQLFTNISQHSPPLGLYSTKERVTYLYYLGRYHFSNNHFYRSQLCLQSAYDQCAIKFINQKRLILIYLISSNMILGRFPKSIMARPEAAGIAAKFAPIAQAIKLGDIIAFKRALGPESGNEQWFFRKGVLLPLLYRCEMLVWRSLARRVFLLTYSFPSDPTSRKAATLDLTCLLAAAQYCQKVLEGWQRPVDPITQMQAGRTHTNAMFMKTPDLVPPPEGAKILSAYQGTVFGNTKPEYLEIEAIAASLVQQGLLHGYLSHVHGKFAITGSKTTEGGAMKAGFPPVWEVLKARAEAEGKDSEVPGWVQHERRGQMGGVVNLSGVARPVGSGG